MILAFKLHYINVNTNKKEHNMKSMTTKKLVLNRGTVANLENVQMNDVKGGTIFWPLTSYDVQHHCYTLCKPGYCSPKPPPAD